MTVVTIEQVLAGLDGLPAGEYAEFVDDIRFKVTENLRRGRLNRFLQCNPSLSVSDYVTLVAQLYKGNAKQLGLLGKGDSNVWGEIHEKLRLHALSELLKANFGYAQANERASDLAQDACLDLFTSHYPGDVPFMAWAHRILHYEVIRQVERSQDLMDHPQLFDSTEFSDDCSSVDDFTTEVDDQHFFEWAQAQLASESQRLVLVFDRLGWHNDEIAAELGCTPQAVYSLRHRAHAFMSSLLIIGGPEGTAAAA